MLRHMSDSGQSDHAVADGFLGHTVVQLAHVLGRHMDRVLAPHDLSATSFSALFHLREEPSVSAAELARRVLITPQSLGPVLDRLEHLGLVERHRPGVRGARVRTEVTSAGRRRLDDAVSAVQALDRWLVAGLPARRRDQVADALGGLLARAANDDPPTPSEA